MGDNQQEALAYDEFGVPMVETGANLHNPFGFTGYQPDEISRLKYAQARYYEPNFGRFSSVDIVKGVIMNPQTLNEYQYCLNQPLDLVDLSGEIPQWLDSALDWAGNRWDDLTDSVGNALDSAKTWVADNTGTQRVIALGDSTWLTHVRRTITSNVEGGNVIVHRIDVGDNFTGLKINVPVPFVEGGTASLNLNWRSDLGANITYSRSYSGSDGMRREHSAFLGISATDFVNFGASWGNGSGQRMSGSGFSIPTNPIASATFYSYTTIRDNDGTTTRSETGVRIPMVFIRGAVAATVYAIMTLGTAGAAVAAGVIKVASVLGIAAPMALALKNIGSNDECDIGS